MSGVRGEVLGKVMFVMLPERLGVCDDVFRRLFPLVRCCGEHATYTISLFFRRSSHSKFRGRAQSEHVTRLCTIGALCWTFDDGRLGPATRVGGKSSSSTGDVEVDGLFDGAKNILLYPKRSGYDDILRLCGTPH